MEEEIVDDPMEIDDTVQNSQIIENTSSTSIAEENAAPADKPKAASDVVVLDDDEEPPAAVPDVPEPPPEATTSQTPVVEIKEIIDLVEKPKNSRCINPSCQETTTRFLPAPELCLSHFRVKRSKRRKEEVCDVCFYKCLAEYEKLSNQLVNGKLLFDMEYPIINETLQIDDSDDEECNSLYDRDIPFDEKTFGFIHNNIDKIIETTLAKFDLDSHLNSEMELVEKAAQKNDDTMAQLQSKLNFVRTSLDSLQINMYNDLRPDRQELRGLVIIDDVTKSPNVQIRQETLSPQKQLNLQHRKTLALAQQESLRKSARLHKPNAYIDLDGSRAAIAGHLLEAPPGDLPKEGLKIGELYFIARENAKGPWVKAKLQVIVPPGTMINEVLHQHSTFQMLELRQNRMRYVSAKNIAYMSASKYRLPVGTRVVSAFQGTEDGMKPIKDKIVVAYYCGIVAEQPMEMNKYRYLIFFDIGYSQYVAINKVHLILESSAQVWEDMPKDCREFIKKYLESQDRPMVKLAKDQMFRIEYKGRWWFCKVVDVDCSLVQIFIDSLDRVEWIYRGSTRLSPIFREEQAASNRGSGSRPTRKLAPNESPTVVQYTRNNDFIVPTNPSEKTMVNSGSKARAMARKSTTRPDNLSNPHAIEVPFLPNVNNNPPLNPSGPTSKIMYFTPRDQIITKRMYMPHTCGEACQKFLTHNFSKLRGHNPLSKPLLCGWGRLTFKMRNKKEIIYKAPCGRVLRNIGDVHYYLRLTKSQMTVDFFDFNHMVRCLAEFSVECQPEPKDLSNGLEQVPIPVMNGINNEMLPFSDYLVKRVPMEGVHMNLDPEFLCGCDCEDDCIDKTKCACWKLTLEGAKFIGKDVDPDTVGYMYRRLPEQVITGIYECNSRCKCKSTCLNRVVQNPMSLKLQVFKTHNRGWGIRCLNDVPQGSFICIYAGTIHTEQTANQDGQENGDEYFAELDYIEVVEKHKEDYEEGVYDTENEKEKRKHLSDDEEDDLQRKFEKAQNANRKRQPRDNDFVPAAAVVVPSESTSTIRTRLRGRTSDAKAKPDVQPEVVKPIEPEKPVDLQNVIASLESDIDTVTISDDEDEGREVLSFNPKTGSDLEGISAKKYTSIRDIFGEDESVFVMDAKNTGNIGRFLNHSCSPNVFVQNVFVDTQDPRFPWVAFFSSQFIRAGTELTWNYNYDVGSVPGRLLYCYCSAMECKGRLL